MSNDGGIESWLEAINLQEYVPILIDQGYDTLQKCATIVDKTALKELENEDQQKVLDEGVVDIKGADTLSLDDSKYKN